MKNFFISRFSKKYLSVISTTLLLFFGLTQFAQASAISAVASVFSDIGYVVIGKTVFVIAYIIAWVGGIIIAVDAWLVGAMLSINTGVFQSEIVQKGFGITLSIANLGFVLGIIIIAIATIFQNDTYGYKKVLWKLIAAAILVNFSLVIAVPIFNLGNSFTQYFLNCVDPGGGGCSGQGAGGGLPGGNNSMNNFAAGLAGAFNPQTGLIGSPTSTLGNNPDSIALGQSLGQMLIPILSVGFVAFELTAIAIVLGALVVLLVIRYIWIAMLAVLMPFAWLGWVFPATKDWWTKWWHNFIRWTFFPPIVVFFLWLGMQTAQSMRNGTAVASQQFATYASNSNPIWGAIANFVTATFSGIIAQVLNTLLLIGLTVGGLIVADRMSLTGAKGVIDGAKSAGKAVQGYAGKQMKKATRAAYDRGLNIRGKQIIPKGNSITTRLQEGRIGALKYIPGAQRAASLAGRGISSVSTNEALVEEAKKKVPKNPEEIKKNLRGSMNMEDRLAHIAKLVEMGEYSGNEMVGNQKASAFLDANQAGGIIDRYGQGKLVKDADKVMGSDKAMRSAEEAVKNAATGTQEALNALTTLDAATEAFISKLNKGDMAKMNVNEIFGKDTVMTRALSRAMAKNAPQLATSAMPKMKSPALKNFAVVYKDEIKNQFRNQLRFTQVMQFDELVKKINADTKLSDAEKKLEIDKIKPTEQEARLRLAFENFDRAFGNNILNAGGETPTGATPPPPGPAPHP